MHIMPMMFIKHVSEIPEDYKFKLWNTVIQNQAKYYDTDLFRYGQEAQDIVNSYKKFISDGSSNLLRIHARVFNPFENFKLEVFNWDDINYTFRIYFDLIYSFKGSKNKQKLDIIETHKNRIFSVINAIKVNLYNIDMLFNPEILLKYSNILDFRILEQENKTYVDSTSYIAWKIVDENIFIVGFNFDFKNIQINANSREISIENFRKQLKQYPEIARLEFPEDLL